MEVRSTKTTVLRPWLPREDAVVLPATRLQRGGGHPVVCAAYLAQCIPGTLPPRAVLSMAFGTGGLGLGVPAKDGGWILRAGDFCKGPPRELNYLKAKRDERGTPKPADCICPTSSLDRRVRDPLGFDRWIPAGGLPNVPRPDGPWPSRCEAGASFVTYQCSRQPLVPQALAGGGGLGAAASVAARAGSSAWWRAKKLLSASTPPLAVSRRKGTGSVDVLLATSDHFGHGVFALVQRVLNQIHLGRSLGLEVAVFLGERTFMEPQACEYGVNPCRNGERACGTICTP